jgi:hypothetical protein
MSELIQVKKKKKISKELQVALDNLLIDFEKLQSKVDKVFDLGRKEGLDDMKIGSLVRKKMKEEYSQRTIQRVLPETAKRDYNMNKNKNDTVTNEQESDKMSDSEQETIATTGQEPQHESEITTDVNQTDPNRTFKETITAKNKIIKQQQEEIQGLRTELAVKNKKITQLEKRLSSYENKKPKKKIDIQKEKHDTLFLKGLSLHQKFASEKKNE